MSAAQNAPQCPYWLPSITRRLSPDLLPPDPNASRFPLLLLLRLLSCRRYDSCSAAGAGVELFWTIDKQQPKDGGGGSNTTSSTRLLHMAARANLSTAAGYLAVGFGNDVGGMVPASVAAAVATAAGQGYSVHDYRVSPATATDRQSAAERAVRHFSLKLF